MKAKGLKRHEPVPKPILLDLISQGLSPTEISKKLNISIFKIKMSLIHHGLFKGKTYENVCEGCGIIFQSFIKGVKFHSNDCKHRYQMIWNRGKTKYICKKVKKHSDEMSGNLRGFNSEKYTELYLPKHDIKVDYSQKSNTEKDFLLSLDENENVLNVERANFAIPYIDSSSNKQYHYKPDYIVRWKDNLIPWIVEIKGFLQIKDLDKIIAAQKYSIENNFKYKLITKGLIKYSLWDKFYFHVKSLKIPSKEYVFMSAAVATSLLSCSHSIRVGCVISSDNYSNFLSFGYNGDEKHGTNLPNSINAGESGFIHAEENALIKLGDAKNAIMFLTDSPCEMCAKKIINSEKIKEVYYLREYRDLSGVGLLSSHGIQTFKFQIMDNNLKALSDADAYQSMIPIGFHN